MHTTRVDYCLLWWCAEVESSYQMILVALTFAEGLRQSDGKVSLDVLPNVVDAEGVPLNVQLDCE